MFQQPVQQQDVPVQSPPSDSVQVLRWSTTNHIVSGSWDSVLRVWEVAPNGQSQPRTETKLAAPVLDACWHDDAKRVFGAACDKSVRMWDLTTNQLQQVAAHDAPIKVCQWIPSLQALMTGGWDKMLKFWDLRQQAPVATFQLPERCYAADVSGDLCVVATADRHIVVYNLGGGAKEFSRVQTSLKMQTRCVSCFPSRDGYAVGSIEGRVALQYVDAMRAQKDNFSFKCHRDDGIYAINSISFHPRYGTFATAGSDGKFLFWDKDSRNRLKMFPANPAPLTTCGFNGDGSLFAYAVSYDWSRGHEHYNPQQQNMILVHPVNDEEIKPKKK